jgi:hypothetical protein
MHTPEHERRRHKAEYKTLWKNSIQSMSVHELGSPKARGITDLIVHLVRIPKWQGDRCIRVCQGLTSLGGKDVSIALADQYTFKPREQNTGTPKCLINKEDTSTSPKSQTARGATRDKHDTAESMLRQRWIANSKKNTTQGRSPILKYAHKDGGDGHDKVVFPSPSPTVSGTSITSIRNGILMSVSLHWTGEWRLPICLNLHMIVLKGCYL